jgi:prepilin-type N-terminal cleavage/methylation domain-containing protein
MTTRTQIHTVRGFSLIEMMVSVALFSIVMVVSTTALLSLIDANRKAQSLQSVMNNLNVSLDGLVRNTRMGSSFYCANSGSSAPPSPVGVSDCDGSNQPAGNVFAFTPYGKDPTNASQKWVYWYDTSVPASKRLRKSEDGGLTFFPLTAPEVQIDDMKFYVIGTNSGDNQQPRLVMIMKGTAGSNKAKTRSTFNIQATAVQRLLDI